jgi:hypothetical protein
MTQPGHFLTNFIDWMERVAKTPPELKPAHRDTVAHMKRANRSGVRFVMETPMFAVLPDKHRLIGENLRPPYPTTIIEYGGSIKYGDERSYQNVIVAEDLGTHVKLRSYASLGNAGVSVCPFEARLEYVDRWVPIKLRCWSTAMLNKRVRERFETHEELTRSAADILDIATLIYARLCEVLANHEVETTDVVPDDKANRLRRIKGYAPLYTYKTLVIGPPKKRKVVRGGGTHASPRSHMRRGYYRTSRNGVRHWVQACMVMGGTPGFVHKDYKVKQQGEYQ